jgi:hypothetical protein
LQRLEAVLDVRVDALVQVEEFLVNLVIAVVGLAEFQVPGAFLRDAEVGKATARRSPGPNSSTTISPNVEGDGPVNSVSRWRDTGHLERAVATAGGQEAFDAAVTAMLDDARGWRLPRCASGAG